MATTKIRKCRECGCTDDNCRQCIEKTGRPCYWSEPDLCSACDDDPYHDRKPYHMANLFSDHGDVSPLCAPRPRKLNLKRERWTTSAEAVTCRKCIAKLAR